MNLNTVDLNLFLVFQAIYETRSVTLAGERLGMTQSAVSNALKRLRDRFDDPIFVRTLDGMSPSPLAERLIRPVDAGLAQFKGALVMAGRFQPAQSDRLFRVAINEVGHLVMVPALFRALRQQAPHIRLETMALSPAETRQSLMNGQIDLAIGSWAAMGPSFHLQRLFDETFLVLMCSTNALAQGSFDAESYVRCEHLAFRPHGATDIELESLLERTGLAQRRHVVFGSAHANGLAQMLRHTDLLLTLPSRLAREIVRDQPGLAVREMPVAVQPFQIKQQWHTCVHQDASHRWFRDLVFRLFNGFACAAGSTGAAGRRDWVREALAA